MLKIKVCLDEEHFDNLMKITDSRPENITNTINMLLELGIETYLLEDIENI